MKGPHMTRPKPPRVWTALLGVAALDALALALCVLTPTSIRADFLRYNPAPFDFSDAFYRLNGVDPDNIVTRVGNPDRHPTRWIVDPSNTDPTRRGVRVTETTGGFD